MKRFENLSTIKKVLIIVALAVFLVISVIKTYFPKAGISSWSNDINYFTSGKHDEAENKPLSVHFIDVGQGDCTLVKTENECILIDCGNSIDGEEISEYLLSHNVKSIEYLVITHPHSDHYGGATRLLDFIKVKNILMPEIPEELYKDERDFLFLVNKINKMEIPFTAARAGDEYKIGDSIITVLPSLTDSENLNDVSAVLRLDYKETSFLFMGDSEETNEKNLLNNKANLKCDVLKVGHHGSSKGTSKAFLKETEPLVAVISCGYDNEYGHPGEDVLYRLKKNGVSVLRTDLNGTVVVGSDGDKLYISFEKGKKH
ncbi:MAG: MBL fold metallo-hydrolase [Clostridia bacterium]|nr:MBL fold metallo-hydrolase [Clostridia bacterium]